MALRIRVLLLCCPLLASVASAACGGAEDPGTPPIAELRVLVGGVERDGIDLGTTALLDGSRSADPDGDIAELRFTVADGSGQQVTTVTGVDHVFQVAGLIEVHLEVVDRKGNVGTASRQVAVRRP